MAENLKWLEEVQLYWDFTVTNEGVYSAVWNNQSEYLNLEYGGQGEAWIEFVNNGTLSWESDKTVGAMHLGTSVPLDRSIRKFSDSTLHRLLIIRDIDR